MGLWGTIMPFTLPLVLGDLIGICLKISIIKSKIITITLKT